MNKIFTFKASTFWGSIWLLLLLIPFNYSCSRKYSDSKNSFCWVENRPCLQGKIVVAITTNKGTIKLELDGDSAPVTAGNFLDLINKGVYEQTVFHRVIRKPSPFILQAGDPFSKDPNTQEIDYGKGSFIDPKTGQIRFIPLEIKLKTETLPRYNQLITNPKDISELQLVHQRGSVAMARSMRMDSGSSQFYIALKPLPVLDGRYSVFGKVVQGKEILEEIREGDIIIKTRIIKPI